MTEGKPLSGFGNHFSSEALAGALPEGQNTPQKVPFGLYAEQISGSPFTAPRVENLRTWFYRIRPSVLQGSFQALPATDWTGEVFRQLPPNPNPARWNPVALPEKPTDFLEGIIGMAGNGGPEDFSGCAVHLYAANRSMEHRFFYNSDAEILLVPQLGKLELRTECGVLIIQPTEIAVIPRGIKFQVHLPDGPVRGYLCENFGAPLRLPYLGLIGSNGLANPRDFTAPSATYEERSGQFKLLTKFQGNLFTADIDHSPLDVVAWHGNYYPYRYDLKRFQTYGPISFDHPDPSIFTVLTSPSPMAGMANVDFVLFPPRWLVMENTFRPPYFHRNCMSEFMGLVAGVYDGKLSGFLPGGASLHNCMTGHGPDAEAYEKAIQAELKPNYLKGAMAFMLESSRPFRTTKFANETSARQKDYQACWQGLKANFKKS